jgi:chemotaxis-related protein WspB
MLVLLVHIADQLYCIRAAAVVEVVPRVPLQPVPHAPAEVAGLLHYRSQIIPVLDLRTLLAGEASCAFLSTRIVIAGESKRIGLVAERLTEAVDIDENAITPAPVTSGDARWLGGVLVHDGKVARELLLDHFTVEAVA